LRKSKLGRISGGYGQSAKIKKEEDEEKSFPMSLHPRAADIPCPAHTYTMPNKNR